MYLKKDSALLELRVVLVDQAQRLQQLRECRHTTRCRHGYTNRGLGDKCGKRNAFKSHSANGLQENIEWDGSRNAKHVRTMCSTPPGFAALVGNATKEEASTRRCKTHLIFEDLKKTSRLLSHASKSDILSLSLGAAQLSPPGRLSSTPDPTIPSAQRLRFSSGVVVNSLRHRRRIGS